MKKRWQGWIITADWYDQAGCFPDRIERTRKDAIAAFRRNNPDSYTWRHLKRLGWRCARATVRW